MARMAAMQSERPVGARPSSFQLLSHVTLHLWHRLMH